MSNIWSQDDLLLFHKRVYGKSFIGNLSDPENDHSSSIVADENYREADDELGYYDDGAKRTLTDEQIAMFRHSEIQALLQARRQAREKTTSDYKDVPRSKEMENGVWGVEEAEDDHGGVGEGELSDGDDEEEYARFLEAERKEMELAASKQTNKVTNGQNPRGKASTRRIVREMDAVVSTNDTLDYGDEPDDAMATPDVPDILRTAQDIAGPKGQGGNKTGVGKKFRWPVLQM